jgi:uncharacterized protein GlcG (DUF336 family)
MLTQQQAASISAASLAKANQLGAPASIAVLDAGGHLMHYARTDDVPLAAIEIAQSKAWTALAFGTDTANLVEYPDLSGTMKRPIAQFPGGLVLKNGNTIIGSLGVGGGLIDNDVAIASAGAQALA